MAKRANPVLHPPKGMGHCRAHKEYTSGCVGCYAEEYSRQTGRPGPTLSVVPADERAKSVVGDLLRVEDGEDVLPWAEVNVDDHTSGIIVFGANQAEADFRAQFIKDAVTLRLSLAKSLEPPKKAKKKAKKKARHAR